MNAESSPVNWFVPCADAESLPHRPPSKKTLETQANGEVKDGATDAWLWEQLGEVM